MKRSELNQIKEDKELIKALESLEIDIDEVFKADDEDEDDEDDKEEEKAKMKKGKKVKKSDDEDEDDEPGESESEDEDEDDEEKAKPRKKKPAAKPEEKEGLFKALADSINEVVNRLNKIESTIEKIGSTPQGLKAKQNFEKSFETETDHLILSLGKDKNKIENTLMEIMEKSNDSDIKGQYENSIISLNAGNGTIGKDVAIDLFKNHRIRIVK